MAKKENIVRATAEAMEAMARNGESQTDWAMANLKPQAEIEQLADEDDGTLPEGWEQTVVWGTPSPRQGVYIRLETDVLAWFKASGPGYQTRINMVLRAFVEARRQRPGKPD